MVGWLRGWLKTRRLCAGCPMLGNRSNFLVFTSVLPLVMPTPTLLSKIASLGEDACGLRSALARESERQPGLQIRALKFQSSSSKFPRARTCELVRARPRLYRSPILQVNTRWTALAEIYTMHSFAPFSNLNFFVTNRQFFCH